MELETLIAQITAEVCARLQNQNMLNYQGAESINLASHIEYTKINPQIKIDEIRNLCETAKQKKYACVSIPQWFVAFAKQLLTGTDVKISTLVGLPGGNSVTEAKYAEVKLAVENGADEVDIPINMVCLKRNDLETVKRDLQESMIPGKGKALIKAIIEAGDITKENLAEAITIVNQCGVDYIVISNILSGCTHEVKQIKEMVSLCKANIGVKVLGGVKNHETASALILAGVKRIGSSFAETIA